MRVVWCVLTKRKGASPSPPFPRRCRRRDARKASNPSDNNQQRCIQRECARQSLSSKTNAHIGRCHSTCAPADLTRQKEARIAI